MRFLILVLLLILNYLLNLEGSLDFLIKDLNLDTEIPESTFLRALRILNLNAIVEGLDDASDDIVNINRASGRINRFGRIIRTRLTHSPERSQAKERTNREKSKS